MIGVDGKRDVKHSRFQTRQVYKLERGAEDVDISMLTADLRLYGKDDNDLDLSFEYNL